MEKEIKIQELISIILRKWWIVAILTVLFGVVFCLYSKFVVKEQFTSYGSLYVNNKAQDIVSTSEINNTANLYDLTTADLLVETYKLILSSNNFFDIIKENTDFPYTAKELKKFVSYESIEETNIIEVYAVGYSPQEAQKLCDAVLKYANNAIMNIVEVGSVKTIDDATLPEGHSYPNTTQNTMLGMIFGFILACGIIFLMYYFDVKIKSAEDIESRCDLIVLGTIPNMTEETNSKIGGAYND